MYLLGGTVLLTYFGEQFQADGGAVVGEIQIQLGGIEFMGDLLVDEPRNFFVHNELLLF